MLISTVSDMIYDHSTGKWLGEFTTDMVGRVGIFHTLRLTGLIEVSSHPRTPEEMVLALGQAIVDHFGIERFSDKT